MVRHTRIKYSMLPVLVLLVAGVFWAADLIEGGLSIGEILNLVFVAVLVSITWFYVDETAMLRANAVQQLQLLGEAHQLKRARLAFGPVCPLSLVSVGT